MKLNSKTTLLEKNIEEKMIKEVKTKLIIVRFLFNNDE